MNVYDIKKNETQFWKIVVKIGEISRLYYLTRIVGGGR